MGWNPNDYEMVESRIARFYEQYEDGRLITELVPDENEWVFKAVIYLNGDEELADTPKSTGWATEKKSSSPFSAEVAETSSLGRALANMGLHGNKRASREEMRKVPNADRNYIAEAIKCTSADELRLLWTEAKAAGVPQSVLDEVQAHAQRLQDSPGERAGGSASVPGKRAKK